MALSALSGATLDANESSSVIVWCGGYGNFFAEGTWDTSTVTLECQPPGGDAYVAVSSATTFTADGNAVFHLPKGYNVRATMSSVGASSDVDVWIDPIESKTKIR
jgi:hypothetical protein